MSQTAVAPGGSPPSAPSTPLSASAPATASGGLLQARVSAAAAAFRHALDGTPGRLRVLAAIAVLATIVIALGGGAALRERSAALGQAGDASAHLVLLQGVQTKLVQADADATNSFLVPGLEPVNQRLDYIASIEAASRDLAVAANAGSPDAAALGAVNAALTRYTGYISSARANNREGHPVGASYLRTANALLATSVLPQLQKLSDADRQQIDAAYSRATRSTWLLGAVAVIGLAGLLWAQVRLAGHSRRILNPPLALASLALVLVLAGAGAAMALAGSRANNVRSGALAQATALSTSRVAAFNAKSNESLVLIARGSATSTDDTWAGLLAKATTSLPAGSAAARQALAGYATKHKALNDQDVAGQWKAAVAQATASGATSANGQFASYAEQTQSALTAAARATASGLDKAGNALLPAGILVVLVGLLAAVAAWWGVSLRLEEYR